MTPRISPAADKQIESELDRLTYFAYLRLASFQSEGRVSADSFLEEPALALGEQS